MLGLRVEVVTSKKIAHIFHGTIKIGSIICRSMDRPESIIGFKIANALVDEIDTLTTEKADAAWKKIIARLRLKVEGVVNGVGITTTPEGFKFVYNRFKKNPSESYSMVQASTHENAEFLPPDYIASLIESYPPQLVEAYLNGEFVNLTSGTVYSSFDRMLNHTNDTIRAGDTLHIGLDFNVMNMSAVVHVMRDGVPHAVREFTGVRDTPTIAAMFKDMYRDNKIVIYPDASGQNTSSKSASVSDVSILRQAGFIVRTHTRNPAVKDRVNAMQAMLCNANGERRYFVNTNDCPEYTEALEKQAYDKNGAPDKDGGFDHLTDAGGYFIEHKFPINRPITKQTALHL